MSDARKWLGPFTDGAEALDQLRRSVAEIIGADPDTWPDHGNAPLAIAAAIGLRQAELNRCDAAPPPAADAVTEAMVEAALDACAREGDEPWRQLPEAVVAMLKVDMRAAIAAALAVNAAIDALRAAIEEGEGN